MPKKSSKGRSPSAEAQAQAPPLKRRKEEEEEEEEEEALDFQSPESLFESLIRPMGRQEFFRDFWEKKPLLLQRRGPETASYYASLFQLKELQALCRQPLRYGRDLNVVRCLHGNKKLLNKDGRVRHQDLSASMLRNRATLQIHQPQRFKDELWKLQEKLESFFGSLVGSNIYITPQDSQGLPPHYDDVEIFILQLEGEKRWRLYSPTQPLASEYGVVSEAVIGSPTHDVTLKTGDLLYFPRGTIHQASTPQGVEHSTHLTLSTYQRTSVGDLLLDVFPGLMYGSSRAEVELRRGVSRRLLLDGREGDADSRGELASCLRTLADRVEAGRGQLTSSHMRRDFVVSRLPPYQQEQLLSPAGRIPVLEDRVCLRCKDHTMVLVEPQEQSEEMVVFVLHSLRNQRESHMMGEGVEEEEEEEEEEQQQEASRGLQFPLSHLAALQQLQRAEQLQVSELQLPSEEQKNSLVLALWSEGLLTVCHSLTD